ncbi:unnamed protein product [Cladocopium goreaui]|uniref:alpha-1,3-mannosyl-glycoprotein 2-beta-N-acetylglucosaminyltransferase n=1 Tax=Cladocopium goreaui TaxID=2562237 RepID=A0A9P1BQV4_9DINO|nr:unnamed protein product [Cladocopium goreaui]
MRWNVLVGAGSCLERPYEATGVVGNLTARAVKSAVHSTKPPLSSSERVFQSSSKAQAVDAAQVAPSPSPSKLEALGGGRAGIVIVAHDRTDTLARCLDSLLQQPDLSLFRLAVSLDHAPSFDKMEAVVRTSSSRYQVNVWKKPDDPKQKVPVAKIAAHFRFALSQSFEVAKFEFAIFIENDLVLAPDFLWYFRITAPLLEHDPSIWCVSSWNDNGFSEIASDERKLFRTDYFPGLGWMIRNDTWSMLAPLWSSFPSTGWDHWIRHGVPQLRYRDCVAPEVPRSKHVDTKGTNVKAGSGIYKLLEKMAFSKLPNGELHDVSYLLRDRYEPYMQKVLQDAQMAPNLESLRDFVGQSDSNLAQPVANPKEIKGLRPLPPTPGHIFCGA